MGRGHGGRVVPSTVAGVLGGCPSMHVRTNEALTVRLQPTDIGGGGTSANANAECMRCNILLAHCSAGYRTRYAPLIAGCSRPGPAHTYLTTWQHGNTATMPSWKMNANRASLPGVCVCVCVVSCIYSILIATDLEEGNGLPHRFAHVGALALMWWVWLSCVTMSLSLQNTAHL